MARKRIWCETVSIETLTSRAVVGLLRGHGVDPILAVQPGQQGALSRAIALFRDAGLRPSLWPMLDDTAGRWGSAWNAPAFASWVRAAARAAGPAGDPPLEIVLDLEPPIALMASMVSRGWGRRHGAARAQVGRRMGMRKAAALLCSLTAELRAAGYRTISAVAPMVLLDKPPAAALAGTGLGGWQVLLGTPVDGISWDGVAVMAYSSILRGWSGRLLDEPAVHALVGAAAELAVRRYGEAAIMSLGAVGAGAFGDEPAYRHVGELARDAALVRAGGVNDIALFELGGVLRRRAPEVWLEALDTEPANRPAAPSRRSRMIISACTAVSRIVGAVSAPLVFAGQAG